MRCTLIGDPHEWRGLLDALLPEVDELRCRRHGKRNAILLTPIEDTNEMCTLVWRTKSGTLVVERDEVRR